jgi:hypothetical protein
MRTLILTSGSAQVGQQTIALDGSVSSVLRLALALAEGGAYRGRAGDATCEAREARGRGLGKEARATEFAVHVWRLAWTMTEKTPCPVRDHTVHSAAMGLLRLGDTIEDRSLWSRAFGTTQWSAIKAVETISHAITGSREWLADADGGDTTRDAVLGMTEDRQWYLMDYALPALSSALVALRVETEQAIVTAYERGRRDGTDILARMAKGDASASEFEGARK